MSIQKLSNEIKEMDQRIESLIQARQRRKAIYLAEKSKAKARKAKHDQSEKNCMTFTFNFSD